MTHNYNFDKPPHIISVTFYRDVGDLPLSLEETDDEEVRVTDVSFLAAPIEEGDELLSVDCNGHSYGAKDLLQYKLTGVMTLRFQKANACANPHLRGSFFVQPQAHTCLPMAMDLQQQNGSLSIVSVDASNLWLSNAESCLQAGQSVVAVNGTPCHQLEDDDAILFMQTKLDMDPYLYITTTTLPPEAMTGLLAEEEEILNKFVRTLKDGKAKENYSPHMARVGDYSAFDSSKQLFVAIQKSLARIQIQNQAACQSLGRGLYSFCQSVLSTVLQDYARHLKTFLPSPTSKHNNLKKLGRNLTGKAKPTPNWGYKYRVDTEPALARVCQVIATCEYAANQSQALQEMLQELQETTTQHLADAIEAFHEVIAKATQILVSGILQRLKDPLLEMRGIHYRKIKVVEEENPYVHTIQKETNTYLQVVTQDNLLPKCYQRSFCDKFVLAFCEVYYDLCLLILRSVSKRHHGNTIQQLLMDVYHIKLCFLQFQGQGDVYNKLVETSFRSIEALLKGEWQIEYDPASDSDEANKAKEEAKKNKSNEEDQERIIRVEYSKLEPCLS